MRTAAMITEEVDWMGDISERQIDSIHECMKEYAEGIVIDLLKWMDENLMLDNCILSPVTIYKMFIESQVNE